MAARHALRDHYFHRPYSGRRLQSPLLAIGPMRGLLASEAAGKGAQEASTFHLEMKDDRDLYGKPSDELSQQTRSSTTTSALSSLEPSRLPP